MEKTMSIDDNKIQIHTCSPTCDKPICVLARKNKVMKAALERIAGITLPYGKKMSHADVAMEALRKIHDDC